MVDLAVGAERGELLRSDLEHRTARQALSDLDAVFRGDPVHVRAAVEDHPGNVRRGRVEPLLQVAGKSSPLFTRLQRCAEKGG